MNKLPFELEKRKLLFRLKDKILVARKKSAQELLGKGIVILDKSSGPTSNMALESVKEVLEIRKAGHGGTLDPMVTGVLPIALNKATKVMRTLLLGGKKYEGVMHLHGEISKKALNAELKKFIGKIEQLPPVRSAVKRQLREREVYYFNILSIKKRDVEFEVGTEAGTYVRKLVHDFGESLGVGAHMIKLRRVQHGPFLIKDAVTIEKLEENYENYMKTKQDKYIQQVIMPIESAIEHLSKVFVKDDVISPVKHGSPIYIPGIVALDNNVKKDDLVAIFDLESDLLGLGIAKMNSGEIVKKQKGTAIKTDTVFL